MFNLSKISNSEKKEYYKHYDAYLSGNNGNFNLTNNDLSTINYRLEHDIHGESVADKTIEALVTDTKDGTIRTGTENATTDKLMDISKDLYLKRRLDKPYSGDINHAANYVSESLDQKMRKEFKVVQNEINRDTAFWDKYVGEQMIGKETLVSGQTHQTQLQNHPDRFENLDKTAPTNESIQSNFNKLELTDKYYKMVAASIKELDKHIFRIYCQAEKNNGKICSADNSVIKSINNKKRQLLKILYQT